MRPLALQWLVLSAVLAVTPAQRWAELQGRTKSGAVALHQAILDTGSDALVLLVASHPDDRYVLPAVYLRYCLGARVAVLLASRGGGGQNSLGPESGDALERIRTYETEAGCWHFDGEVYYLNRPDRGFRRTAEETYAEWGREQTTDELVRLLREIRPDVVLTTHSAEETHGHDLAVAELLPIAVAKAADASVPGTPHRVRSLFLGATSTPSPLGITLEADAFEPVRGATYRRLAYDLLLRNHLSPGAPSPMDTVFEAHTRFVPVDLFGEPPPRTLLDGVPSLFASGVWPADQASGEQWTKVLQELPGLELQRASLIDRAIVALRGLRQLTCAPGSDADRRRARRVEALQRVVQHAAAIQVEIEARPGTVAVPGESLDLDVRVHAGGDRSIDHVAIAANDGEAVLDPVDGESLAVPAGGQLHAALQYGVPLASEPDGLGHDDRYHADRFEPPVHFRFELTIGGVVIPVEVTVPIDLRPAVDLSVVPRMLLLPTSSGQLRFTVKVERNSAFPIDREIDLRCPAGYRVEGPRTHVTLDTIRRDIFEFVLTAPTDRRSGVDVVRIGLGGVRVVLPVHKVDVVVDQRLRVGLVRSMDDALSSVIGAGGFGLHWSGLSDIDLAVGDLDQFDTVVVDVRALRDRPQARQSFRRLLQFCQGRGKRLVVLYHKDTEFEPAGEGFVGAPYQPFQVGRNRVTRADSPVRLLKPDHVLLHSPNEILVGDWDGWEQERGLYFPAVYADAYEELLELQDPGQPAERSALLYARTGDGEYVYCALALWRQLKKLHPGSVRLLANLLTPALPRN